MRAGDLIGPYRVAGKLGEGGMGEVFRAQDTRLGRDVAIKFLHQDLGDESDRRRRFEREARTISGLNHPHICTVHDVGRHGDRDYLVMELVEGETLSARLVRGPVPIRETLRVASDIAAALEAAHHAGVIHRDLKPGNVILTKAGAKLLDFGLAKPRPRPAVNEATVTRQEPITAEGTIVGTFQYMAPEQVEGRDADARSDIFALGAILFEMVTGRRAFDADSQAGLVAAILHHDPQADLEASGSVPPELIEIIRSCLAKDPDARFQSAHDLKFALALIAGRGSQAGTPAVARPTRVPWAWLAAGAALLAFGVLVGRVVAPGRPAPGTPVRAVIPLAADGRLDGWGAPIASLSPDGGTLAYVSQSAAGIAELYVHRLDRAEPDLVPGSAEAEGPFFSPDGEWVGFAVGTSSASGMTPELRKYSIRSGLTQTVAEVRDFFGGAWTEDDEVYFVGAAPGLLKVSADGGVPEPAVEVMFLKGQAQNVPMLLPQRLSRDRMLVTLAMSRQLAVFDLRTGEVRELGISARRGLALPTGHLLYVTDEATMFAAPFDMDSATLTGPAVAVMTDVALSSVGAVFSVSDNGTFVYATGYLRGSYHELREVVRISRTGEVERLPFEPQMFNRSLNLSRDGRRAAASIWNGPNWIYDLDRLDRISLPSGDLGFRDMATWSPDDQYLSFSAEDLEFGAYNLFAQATDGSAPPRPLAVDPAEVFDSTWTADGGAVLYSAFTQDGSAIWIVERDDPSSARPLIQGPSTIQSPRLSPDGRWLAYLSAETGTFEVFVQPFPELGPRTPISRGPANLQMWSPDGREIFYRDGARMMVVRLESTDPLRVGPPQVLFEDDSFFRFDVLPDGQGFITLRQVPGSGIITGLHVVVNWFEELRALMDGGR